MKRFFISVLKALGYFGIYLGAQLSVTVVYMIYTIIPVAVKYSVGNYDLTDPVIFERYMEEALQPVLDATMPLTILSGLLTLGVICLIFKCRKKKIAKEVRLCRISGGTALSVGMMGFGINFVLGILFNFLPKEWLESYEATASAAFSGELWLVAITVAVMAPIVEEFLFRGLIYTRLKQGMPMVAAVAVSSLWFGAMHGQPLWIAYASLLGLVMVWIFERTGSLLASMAFHFGYNLVAVISMALPEDTPEWIGIVLSVAGLAFAAVGTYWFLKIPKAEISAETAGETAVYEPEETGDVSEKVTQESGEDSTENP